jgi:hypothetical protein
VAVYVDELFTMQSKNAQAFRVGTRTGHKWCHMFAWPDDAELHVLAQRIGLKPEWVDRSRDGTIHYDLTPKKRAAAIRAGAIPLSVEEAVAIWDMQRDRRRKGSK